MAYYTRTDVTAVKLHYKLILAGIGSYLHIYTIQNLKFLRRICVLQNQKIHSILTYNKYDKFAVVGGKQFRIGLIKEIDDDIEESFVLRMLDSIECVDWIHCAAWVNNTTIVILTAHNTVQVWDICKQEKIHEYRNSENSILYSGVLQPLKDGILVFAGTVFSEVIIHIPTDNAPLQRLKGHRGVIFSISANIESGVIVTTSDDRSVRIWNVCIHTACKHLTADTSQYWRNVTITCKHEVYGHTARVMRSFITDKYIISGGEDSTICVWDHDGNHLQRRQSHQGGSVWCLDVDQHCLVSGGADGAVILHPLNAAKDYERREVFQIKSTPRKVNFTAKHIVILDDTNLIYLNYDSKNQTTHELKHESTFKLLSSTACKQLIAVADMSGKFDVFVENCKCDTLTRVIDTKLNIGKIMSMHWAGNTHVVFCSEGGNISVLSLCKTTIKTELEFVLPQCKERWLTAVAMDTVNKILVVGDRCGNVHIFLQENKEPLKTLKKIHGRYGPTSLTLRDELLITTGRDSTIKYFNLCKNNIASTNIMFKREYEFRWVEKFLNNNDNIVCGFQERTFVVYDVNRFTKMYEIPCGGGHRSWDVYSMVQSNGAMFLNFLYIKNNEIHISMLRSLELDPRYVVNSSHPKEINSMVCFESGLDQSKTYYVTGGEDTTLRVSTIDRRTNEFIDQLVFKHLSNIRTVKVIAYLEGLLVVAAGGRAQVCIRQLNLADEGHGVVVKPFELVDYLIKGRDKQRENNRTWKDSTFDFDPETRIMDVEMIRLENDEIIIFAGCSDAYLRLFSYSGGVLKPMQELLHHNTCVLKIVHFELSSQHYLVTCATRGDIALWDVSKPFSEDLTPVFTMKTNKAGINGLDVKVVSGTEVLIATGGDDNSLHLNLIRISDGEEPTGVKFHWSTDKFHSSQITGVAFADEYLLSTSIDQRVTFSKWYLGENGIKCDFISQKWTDVADIQGLEIQKCDNECVTLAVYGKGIELINFFKLL